MVANAAEMQNRAKDQARSLYQKVTDKARKIGPFGWAGIVVAGALLAAGSVIGLIVLTPLFIIFSPILVPVGLFLFTCAAGIFVVAGVPMISVTAITWLYRYYRGKHPVGSGKVDYAVSRLHDTAKEATQKTFEVATQVQAKAQEPMAAAT